MNKDQLIRLVNEKMWEKGEADVPQFGAGDTITVTYRIVEGNKERLQSFRGVVIQIKGTGKTKALIDSVNNAATVAKGNVVFVSDDTRRSMHDIKSKVRMADTS